MVPTFMETLYWGIAAFFGYVLFYALVDRICNCFEKCATAKAFGQFQTSQKQVEEMFKENKHGKL